MNNKIKNYKYLFLASILVIVFFTSFVQPVHAASLLDNIVNGVKDLVAPTPAKTEPKQDITIDSKIALAKNGDFNKDSNIEGGNMVTFSYTIINNTKNNYRFATLNTNIPRKFLYYFQNMQGAFSMEEKDGSMNIPNLYIPAQQKLSISFDSKVLYFSDGDKNIRTQAQLFDQSGKLLAESKEFKVNSKALSKEKIQALLGPKVNLSK